MTGPPVEYARVKVVEAEKEEAPLPQCGWFALESAVAAMAKRAGIRVSTPHEWPAYKPPYPPTLDAVVVDPQGHVWVRLERPFGDDQQTYDVFDQRGQRSRRVQLPNRTELVAFGRSRLYLARRDKDDLLYLQRYQLPPETSGPGAQRDGGLGAPGRDLVPQADDTVYPVGTERTFDPALPVAAMITTASWVVVRIASSARGR